MTNTDYIYGIHAVIEALKSNRELEKVFIQSGLKSERFVELKKLLYEKGIVPHIVPAEKLNRLVPGKHQGIVAFISPVRYQDIELLVPYIYEQGEQPLLLVSDRITDVRNFGAIARTAYCAGVHGLIFPEKGSAMLNADAMKASAGALNNIPVCRSVNLKKTLIFLKNSGIKLVGCTEKASLEYTNIDYNIPCAIIVGSEKDGISSDILKLADELVKIPMKGNISSLNVSVAAAIVLYETVKQRN